MIVFVKISFIIQYFKHEDNLEAILNALQTIAASLRSFTLEVLVHFDSARAADVALRKRLKKAAATPPGFAFKLVLLQSGNVHEIRGYNKAFVVSRGELVCFMQDDDLLFDLSGEFILNALKAFENDEKLAVAGFKKGK